MVNKIWMTRGVFTLGVWCMERGGHILSCILGVLTRRVGGSPFYDTPCKPFIISKIKRTVYISKIKRTLLLDGKHMNLAL